jgi:simple sugar transport system ATP-binding protein
MVGRPVQLVVSKSAAQPGEEELAVAGLTVLDPDGRTVVDGISFSVRRGEIVGIAGVQGNGQTELVKTLTGLQAASNGSVQMGGEDITAASPRLRHERGMAHIPEDRQRFGLVVDMTIAQNLVLTRYHSAQFSSAVSIDWNKVYDVADDLVKNYDVRTTDVNNAASTLSGGNQQKVIVARELSRNLRLVVASQPTRGVDVGSIEYIHSQIVKERDAGTAVLIVSTELDEVMALSDRVLVMYRGKIVAEVDPKTTSAMDVGLFMAGSKPQGKAS